ncbi:hypothetical protein [Sulfurimonas sp.]|uniref:hypothetical protein n=1 Tax=Sulfurimonas sp. TaxID=2022749 RepID=UPI00286E09C0|nr:hypothetical protein [Sulfurimonas sp.]
MAKSSFLKNIEKVKSSAAMSEQETKKKGLEKKKKLINIPVEWEEKIRSYHGGTLNAYIIMALQERMQKDGLM